MFSSCPGLFKVSLVLRFATLKRFCFVLLSKGIGWVPFPLPSQCPEKPRRSVLFPGGCGSLLVHMLSPLSDVAVVFLSSLQMASTVSQQSAPCVSPSSRMTCSPTVSQCGWRTCPRRGSFLPSCLCLWRGWQQYSPRPRMASSFLTFKMTQMSAPISWTWPSQLCSPAAFETSSSPLRTCRSRSTSTGPCWPWFPPRGCCPSMTTSACVSPVRTTWSASLSWSSTARPRSSAPTPSCSAPSTPSTGCGADAPQASRATTVRRRLTSATPTPAGATGCAGAEKGATRVNAMRTTLVCVYLIFGPWFIC